MKNLKYIFLILFLLQSCAIKQPVIATKSVQVVLKTPMLRYFDVGFVNYLKNAINIELYNVSVPILELFVGKKTCINKICYDKTQFNIQFLGYKYYPDFLSDVFLKKPIYNAKNLINTQGGFKQSLHVDGVMIEYEVDKNFVKLVDKKHKNIIKISLIK